MRDTQFYVQIAVWSQVVSALLFMGVLVWLWFKFIQPAILGAQDRQNKQIAQAERHRDIIGNRSAIGERSLVGAHERRPLMVKRPFKPAAA